MSDAELKVTVRAEQPLALGITAEVSFFTNSHPFVPGSVLRGALAAAWIAEYGPPTRARGVAHAERFRELFDGRIRYGPLFPAGSQREPLSVRHCKYPKSDSLAACQAVAVDLAFERRDSCTGCGGELEPSKGELILPAGLVLHRRVRTSIDPTTSLARDGHLYATAAIPVGTSLVGRVHGTHPWLVDPRVLRLGGRRSVGGAAAYRVEPAPVASVSLAVGDPLVFRLVSPAILVDMAGRPRLDPDPDLDLGEGLALADSWSRPMPWDGWHAASGLPKPREICAAAGSTYRVTGNHDDLVRLGDRLLRRGLGLRRAEGFGAVEIAAGPWQRVTAEPSPAPVANAEVHASLKRLKELNLHRPEWRWLTGALRELQLERQRLATRGAVAPGALGPVLEALLTQPTAARLSGSQRDRVRSAVADLSSDQLRDLTTLALAGLTAAGSGTGTTGGPQ